MVALRHCRTALVLVSSALCSLADHSTTLGSSRASEPQPPDPSSRAAWLVALPNDPDAHFAPATDDSEPVVSIDFVQQHYTVTEGQTATVTVRLSGQPSRTIRLGLRPTPEAGATATDYEMVPPEITFGPTDTERTFLVRVLQDTEAEGSETIAIGFQRPLPENVVAGLPATTNVTMVDSSTTPASNVIQALRARVTAGAVFFNGKPMVVADPGSETPRLESAQFAHASSYLALSAQPRVWRFGTADDRGGYSPLSIEPLLNLRLTTIPVQGAGSGATTSDGIRVPDASFLQSQKSAEVQLGVLTSLNFGAFGIGDARFHWTVGGGYRTIFQSVTDAQRALRIWNVDDDLYDAHVVGLRLALNEKSESSGVWMPAAYVDIAGGWFQNFEIVTPCNPTVSNCGATSPDNLAYAAKCLAMPAHCLASPPSEDAFRTVEKRRLYVEARVFLKPVYVGFDINNGHGYDDVRFSAGVTFELGSLFASPEP